MEIYAVFLMMLYILILLVGIPGNFLIIMITANRSVKKSVHVFIIALAVADLVACSLAPFGVHYWLYEKMYHSLVMCKLYIAVSFFGTFSTMFLTIAIAFDRYFAVCHPLKAFLSPARACVVCVVCFVGALFCVPACTAFGIRKFGPVVSVCTLTARPWLLEVVGALITIAFFMSAIMLIILYVHMFFMVQRQARLRVRVAPGPAVHFQTTKTGNRTTSNTLATVSFEVSQHRSIPPSSSVSHVRAAENQTSREQSVETQLSTPEGNDNTNASSAQRTTTSGNPRPPQQNVDAIVRAMTNKTTKMLILSTMVFIVSWLPNIIIKALPTSKYQAINNNHPAVITLVRLFEYMFLINHAANPFVYSLVNVRFRRLCAQYLQKIRQRLVSH